jgi:hypothetical protein
MPRDRLEKLCAAIGAGEIANVERLQSACLEIRSAYDEDSWAWTCRQTGKFLDAHLDEITPDRAREFISQFCEQQQKFLRLVLIDAEREYDEGSRIGFGFDGDANAADDDFTAVRGTFAANSFVKQVTAEIKSLPGRCELVSNQISN